MSGTRIARSGAFRLLVLGVAFAVLIGAGAWVATGYLQVGEIRVPSAIGLGYEEAAARMRDAGLEPRAFVEVDRAAAPNEVVSQSPATGHTVRPGRVVALGVNGLTEAAAVPTLVGLDEVDAVARADAVGVPVERVAYVGSERPVGSVIAQQPLAGAVLVPGEGVGLTVSRGPGDAPVVLPDVVGRNVDEAVAELEVLGIRHVEQVAAAVSFDRPRSVTDQRPSGGSSVLPSTPVTLVYALEGTRIVEVPDVAGLPLWRAQLTLRAAQLDLGAVQRIDDPSLPEGVVEARPAGYTVVGSPVSLVVNGPSVADDRPFEPFDFFGGERPPGEGFDAGPVPGEADGDDGDGGDAAVDVPAPGTTVAQADGSRLIPFRFDPGSVGVASLTREPYRLTLVVADAEGERTVLDRDLGAGEGVSLSVRVVGDDPLVQTFINGSFFQAWRP
ncbi:MAG: PASTA domain-containing protein [Trueperaceae bacterium]